MRHLSWTVPALTALFAAGTGAWSSAQDPKDRAADVVCAVEKGSTILSLSPERTLVKKGNLVGELDASDLREKLADLGIAVKRAEGEYQYAKAAREVAELAVKEYVEGKYLQDKVAIQIRIKLAESELARSESKLDQTRKLYETGTTSKAQRVADELGLQKVRFDLELAMQELNLYENLSKVKAIKQLRAAAARAAADEAVCQAVLDLAKAREKKTRRQVEACRITAPCDGRVTYAMRPAGPGEGQDPVPIREGDRVRERQVVVRVIPPSP
jgi:HlyD family secretion protein